MKRDDFLQYDPPNLGNNMGYGNQFEGQHVQVPFESKSTIPLDSNQELINEDDQSNEIPIGPLENLDGPKVEGNVRLKDLLTFSKILKFNYFFFIFFRCCSILICSFKFYF